MLIHFGTLDAVILGIIAVGMIVGFFQGVLRQIFLLAAVYFGIVLAAQYYLVAANALALVVRGGEMRAYSTVGLILVFVISVLALNAVGYHVYRSTRLPVLAVADHLGGAALGILSAWLFISLSLTATDFALAMPLGGMADARSGALELLNNSVLVPKVHNVMPMIYETLRPWVPAGLPAPFTT